MERFAKPTRYECTPSSRSWQSIMNHTCACYVSIYWYVLPSALRCSNR
jgi:hypothetical protein